MGDLAASVKAYDEMTKSALLVFFEKSNAIGGEVKDLVPMLTKAFRYRYSGSRHSGTEDPRIWIP